ncbi:MAG TPA: hypothetical protein VHX13_00855 [Acidobacteriaceae bacterium]|jgi:hypothetical protein|nr:hypothetical protein [Acidobacteriaceae bacterium]
MVALPAAAFLAASPALAFADAGIPLLPVKFPSVLWFLVPVILIEVAYLQAALHTRWLRTALAVISVNVGTTGLGYPLAWLLYAALNQYAAFPGGRSGALTEWRMVPIWVGMKFFPDWSGMQNQLLAILVIFLALLVPSYLFSRYLKTWVIDWYDLLRSKGDTRSAVLMANRFSYLIIAITGCGLLYLLYHR